MIPDHIQNAQRVLIIGGARSGKSTLAERLLAEEAAVDYVATSATDASDVEWDERIAQHRSRRPDHWHTIESVDLVAFLESDGPPLLIDCLTVWLTRIMDRYDAWNDSAWSAAEAEITNEVSRLVEAIAATSRRLVLVTNEVGQGVVPLEASVRRFRDQMGWTNQRIAAVCDEAVFAAAGRFTVLEEWS